VAEPTARRPTFAPSYGISEKPEGLLPWSWAAERLASARNYWIVTASPDAGPHAAPVWGLWLGDAFLFGTSPTSRKGRNLAHDPRVTVHLESGDEVVILEGEVVSFRLNDELADTYKEKYAFRPDPADGWNRVEPKRVFAWREEDFPQSATRFDFG
jgi:Pyridoxamine 5'-phosphate oxidase